MHTTCAESLCIICILALCAGCSHDSWRTMEESSRLPSVAAPILAPINWVAMAGRAVTSTSSESSDTNRGKQFVLSQRVLNEFSTDGKFMEEILAIQTRYRSRDWGDTSGEQSQSIPKPDRGKGAVGRYTTGNKGTAIIITDEGSEFRVRYEDEPAN